MWAGTRSAHLLRQHTHSVTPASSSESAAETANFLPGNTNRSSGLHGSQLRLDRAKPSRVTRGRENFTRDGSDMSESSSGVNTLTGSFPKSIPSQCSDLGVARTPLCVDRSPDSGVAATPLPSSRFRFVSWHRLQQCDVTGDQLACPRVREGLDHIENITTELNLSYQDLGDPFQQENFLRILRRLIRVEKLQLVDNSLTNLSSVRLPRCRVLNLQRNHLVCLRQLPTLPAVEHLCLSENAIGSLRGLGTLRDSPLRSLSLSRNPVAFTQDYRTRVFICLPKLEVLDGIPRLPEDSLPARLHLPETTSMCSIL